MPPYPKIDREMVLNTTFDIIKEFGFECVNARKIAKTLECSTKPLFRLFENMEELKSAVMDLVDSEYDNFISQFVDRNNYLVSKSKAHILFALREHNLYKAMFLSNNLEGISIHNVASAEWNKEAVLAIMNDFSIDNSAAQKVFIYVWLFASGLATELATNKMDICENEIDLLLKDFYERLRLSYA